MESCAQVRLPHGAVAEGSVADAEAVARAVGEAFTRAGSKRRRVALAVSGSQIISRQIAMPVDFSDADIEQQITLESDQYIPYPLDDVYFDFVVLGANARNPQTADVLLIVARNEVVDKRLETLAAAGLDAAVVDVEAYALESVFPLIAPQMPPTARTGVTAMVDVGASTTTLNVLQGGVTLFTREQSFGGEQLLQQIQERYGLAYPEASAALLEGSFPEEWRSTIIEPFLDSLANQVGRLLQVFFPPPDSLLWTTSCSAAAVPGWPEQLESWVAILGWIPGSAIRFWGWSLRRASTLPACVNTVMHG